MSKSMNAHAARSNAGSIMHGHYADLLFEVVTRRYEQQRCIVLTTNRMFGEWNQVFPNAPCVVTLVDRLLGTVKFGIVIQCADGHLLRTERPRLSLSR